MAYGLEVYDSSGSKILSVSYRITRFHSDHTGSVAGSSTDYIYITGMADDGTWAVVTGSTMIQITIESGRLKLYNTYTSSTDYDLTVFRY